MVLRLAENAETQLLMLMSQTLLAVHLRSPIKLMMLILAEGFRPVVRKLISGQGGLIEIREDGSIIPSTGSGYFAVDTTLITWV
jgi:predicted ATP-grasp superfamily ATP-dependent carboligase